MPNESPQLFPHRSGEIRLVLSGQPVNLQTSVNLRLEVHSLVYSGMASEYGFGEHPPTPVSFYSKVATIDWKAQQWALKGMPIESRSDSLPLPPYPANVNLSGFDFHVNLEAELQSATDKGSEYFKVGYHLDHKGVVDRLIVNLHFSYFLFILRLSSIGHPSPKGGVRGKHLFNLSKLIF